MWRITWKGVVAHRLRYLLTALSVLLGVAFIAGTYVLTDTMNGTFNNLYDQIYQGTGAVVRATQPFNPGTSFTIQRDRIDARLAGRSPRCPACGPSRLTSRATPRSSARTASRSG